MWPIQVLDDDGKAGTCSVYQQFVEKYKKMNEKLREEAVSWCPI